MDLLKLPFDQYQRYKMIQEIVDHVRWKPDLTILDVGGAPGTLRRFLPADHVIVSDISDTNGTNILADAVQMPLPTNCIDIVASTDALEHIHPTRRDKFIREMIRISKEVVILGAPFEDPKVVRAEELLQSIIWSRFGEGNPFLEEHRLHGLPDLSSALSIFEECDLPHVTLPNGFLHRWLIGISTYFLLQWQFHDPTVTERANAYYNETFYRADNREPSYRKVIVASQSCDLQDLFPTLCQEPGSSPEDEAVHMQTLHLLVEGISERWSRKAQQLQTSLEELRETSSLKLQERETMMAKIRDEHTYLQAMVEDLQNQTSTIDALQEEHALLKKRLRKEQSERDRLKQERNQKERQVTLQAAAIRQGEEDLQAANTEIAGIKKLLEDIRCQFDSEHTAHVQLQAKHSLIRTSRLLALSNKLWHWYSYLRLLLSMRLGRTKPPALFDSGWYLQQNPDVANRGIDPFVHYCIWGWREGRDPGPLFNTSWYLQANPDVLEQGVEPLNHYLNYGRWENRRPHPHLPQASYPISPPIWMPNIPPLSLHDPQSTLERPGWKDRLRLRRVTRSLHQGRLQRPPVFDPEWYLQQSPDVAQSGIDPFIHYHIWGWKQGRDPHPNFQVKRYLEKYLDVRQAGVEPFEHFLTQGWLEGRDPNDVISSYTFLSRHPGEPRVGLLSLLSPAGHHQNTLPDAELAEAPQTHQQEVHPNLQKEIKLAYTKRADLATYEQQEILPLKDLPVKLLAFYLPQFHPIPENDAFWGPGFTEWTNVSKARPLFEGHQQPRLPGDLGFYDLRLPEVMRKQAALARQHGIYGFCFHYYWFNGRRVLERPVEQFLKDPEIDIHFCLCWANENWTRRWDGADDEVLLRQDHSPEDDLAFIQDAIRHFKDPRYIQIDGKPLLLLYNPQKLPDPLSSVKRWQTACQEAGFEGIFLAAVQSFGFQDPTPIGFDAAVEFPPHNAFTLKVMSDQCDFHTDFDGFVLDYNQLPEIYRYEPKPYLHFQGVVPSWDNTARRGSSAAIYHGSTPRAYQEWLKSSLRSTLKSNEPQHRLLFINAWNEWAESAYLEPDRTYGYAYLNATSRALRDLQLDQKTILFLGHDAYRAGAQILLLNLIRWIRDHTHYDVRIILGRGGVLQPDYEALAPTIILEDLLELPQEEISRSLEIFCGDDVKLLYVNSAASGWMLPYLEYLDVPVLTHVHELEKSIEKFVGKESFEWVRNLTDHYIAVSPPVEQNLVENHGINPDAIDLVHAFIQEKEESGEGKDAARSRLGLAPDIPIIFACGAMHWRKGPDIFFDVAEQLRKRGLEAFHFCWIGTPTHDHPDPQSEITARELDDYVTFLGEVENPREYFAAGDLFLLPSREDPFPLVALEAAECELPIICFDGSGGIPQIMHEAGQEMGFSVPLEDVGAMADKIEQLLNNDTLRLKLGKQARNRVLDHYTLDRAMPLILKTIREVADLKPSVSVIVPAYNHARFLTQRMETILNQSYRDVEIILLDDASTDNTEEVFRRYLNRGDVSLVVNQDNSGSTFAQWAKGIERARAEILWIAEDDDYCELNFLESMLPYFEDPSVRLAYCQSYAVNAENEILFTYTDDQDLYTLGNWDETYIRDASEEVKRTLAIKNTIPNASAVLFRRFDIAPWAEPWTETNLAGDWAFYLHAIRSGKIAFHAKHLNYHRRHIDTNISRTQHSPNRLVESIKVQRLAHQHYTLPRSTIERMRESAFEIFRSIFPNRDRSKFDAIYLPLLHGREPDYGSLHEEETQQPVSTYATCNPKIRKVILPGNDALFLAIPGNGSTAMQELLSGLYDWPIQGSIDHPESEIAQHVIYTERYFEEFSSAFKFAFVRNPFSRLLGVYLNLRYPSQLHPNLVDGVDAGLYKMGFRKEHSFAQFVALACNSSDLEADPNVISQSSILFTDDDKLTVDMLYRFEAFEHEIQEILTALDLQMDAKDWSPPDVSLDHPEQLTKYYSHQLAAAVAKRYARDFKLLGFATEIA